jgi:hypothetical protein
MTCREFMDAAESFTPSQLLRMRPAEEPMSLHARDCAACGLWLESHRTLGNELHALSASTEQRGAGPAVEQAVLEAFRTQGFAPQVVAMPVRTPSALWKLSRVLEFGAYGAVAAALIVGLFLGGRLLRDKQAAARTEQAQTTNAPQSKTQELTAAKVGGESKEQAAKPTRTTVTEVASVTAKRPAASQVSAKSTGTDQAGYIALMLCDPLICSGDEQVVRMELPATVTADGSSAQPVLADVVIGEDGLVRAMRIVNE